MMTTLGWLVAAAALGVAVRAQRIAVRVANERAERAEQNREQEAARRVVEERLRIARDLHDVLAHTVVVISSHSGVAAHLMAERRDGPAELVESLRTIAAARYRIAQEAVTNVIRHARASQVVIRLDRTPTGVCLLVSDDGIGWLGGEQAAGYGILGMQERSRAMGGRLWAGPRPGGGFEVRAELPVGDG